MSGKSKIFFDGNCVVCDMEISHYQKIAPDQFELVDISSKDFDAQRFNLSPEAVERHMHVLTPDGDLKIGVEAFAHIWSRIPKYAFGTKVIQVPGIHGLAKVGYEIFATLRPYLPKKDRKSKRGK